VETDFYSDLRRRCPAPLEYLDWPPLKQVWGFLSSGNLAFYGCRFGAAGGVVDGIGEGEGVGVDPAVGP
jgi:hypothetical protein